jgi:hypothetical protein
MVNEKRERATLGRHRARIAFDSRGELARDF